MLIRPSALSPFCALVLLITNADLPDAAAVPQSGYSFGDASTARPIDPIGLMFVGRAADVAGVQESLRVVMGWQASRRKTNQWIHTGARWSLMGGDHASGCSICTRDHVRLGRLDRGPRPSPGPLADAAVTTVGTPHHDEISRARTCRFPYGHVARRFNETRNGIAGRYRAAGVRVTEAAWGNVALVKQCDGSWVGSDDGRVAVIMLDEREAPQARARAAARCTPSLA